MRLIFFLLFVFCTSYSTAQELDSLNSLFQNELDDRKKIEHALAISEIYDSSPQTADSVIIFRNDFVSFLTKNPSTHLSSKIKYFIGSSYYSKDSTKFFSYLQESAAEAHALNDTATFLRSTYLQAGKLRVLSNTNEALSLLLSGMEYMEGDSSAAINLNRNKFASLISSNYIKVGMFEDALKYGLIAQNTAMNSDDDKLLLRALFNLCTIYGNLSSEEKKLVSEKERERYKSLSLPLMKKAYDLCKGKPMSRFTGISAYNLGVFYSLDSQYVRSKKYLNEAILIGKELPYKELLFNAYHVVSDDYLIEGKLDSADLYIRFIEKLGDEMGFPFHQISAGSNRARYHLLRKEYRKARTIAQENLKLAKEKALIDKERAMYNLLYEIEEGAGNYKKALTYYKEKESLAKQIAGDSSIQKIELLQAQFNDQKQKSQIQELENEKHLQELKINRKNWIIGLVLLLGALMSIFIYYKNKERILSAEKKSLEAQQKLLRMQLNPHFLFNTLNSIQQFIYQKKEPKTVADYLSKFSQLVRRILQNSKEDFISLGVEIDFLRDYMDLQQLRFDSPFNYKINVDEALDIEEVLIPPMFTQPFIENSIEHGNLEKISEGIIEIDFLKKEGVLEIVIKDNGVGIDKTQFKLKNDKHRSMATKITKERLKTMKPKLKRKSKLEIMDLSNLDNKITGTQVILNLPLLYK